MATATSVFITYALLLGPRAPVRETRRSSSASDLNPRCSRSRMACPEMDWGGTSRLPPLSSPSIERIAAVLAAVSWCAVHPRHSAGPRRLAPLRARPALGVSVGEQQSHYCDTEQNKTDRAQTGDRVALTR